MHTKFKNTCLLFILLLSANVSAQNLVPNGDFESLINLPIKPNPKNSFQFEPLSGYKPYIYNINNWFAATKSTPDLRIKDLNQLRICNKTYEHCNRAKSGSICAGIITYQNNSTFTTYREYLEVKLKKKLEIGKTVNIEFWVRREREAKLVTNNLGCYFSEKKVFAEIEDAIKVSPNFNHSELINQEDTKWTKISGKIKLDKAYEYLTIGNFFDNEGTTVEEYENYFGNAYIPPYAYYLIDDVKLWYEGTEPTSPKIVVKKVRETKPRIYTKDVIIENVQVEFDYNQSTLKNNHSSTLDLLIEKLTNSPSKYSIQVIGHTDIRGTSLYNLNLSQKRAETVVAYFIKKGISAATITSSGKGETEPIASNDKEENRQKNRRVEIRLEKVKEQTNLSKYY